MGVNVRYLLQEVECLRGDEVTLAMKDEASPLHITDEELCVVLSPLRVSESVEGQKNKKEGGVPEQADETTTAAQTE